MELRLAPLLTVSAFVRAGLGLAFSVLAIRVVGAGPFGYYSLAWAFCVAFLYMYTGINTVLIAALVEKRTVKSSQEWMAAGLVLTAVMVSLVAAVSAFVAAFASSSGELFLAMVVCPLMLACQIATMFCCALLEGRGHVARAVLLPLVGNCGIVLVLVTSLLAGWPVTGLASLLSVALAAFALEAAIAVGTALIQCAGMGKPIWRGGTVKKLLLGGCSIQAANMVSFLLDPWSKSVLALCLGPASVAVFDLAMKVGWGLNFVFSAYSRLFLQIPPSDRERRIASLTQAADLTWAPLALVGAIAVSLLPPLMGAWLRVDQMLLAQGMAMAVAACLLMAAVSAAYISLIGFGDHAFIFRNQMILGIANVVTASLLVPIIGFPGAFLGSLAATIVNVALISKRLRYHMPGFSGLASLARPFVSRLTLAIILFAVACTASVRGSSVEIVVAVACVAFVLLVREPLARATLKKIHGK